MFITERDWICAQQGRWRSTLDYSLAGLRSVGVKRGSSSMLGSPNVGIIEHIFIAPQKAAAVESVRSVEAVADCGLKGDRYSEATNRKDAGQQVTFIEAEQIDRFVSETGLPMGAHEPRRNIVTRGIELNALLGKRFRSGDCEFEGVELCEPCAVWARNTYSEVVRFFVHKGGLNARIVRGGVLSVGSPVTLRV